MGNKKEIISSLFYREADKIHLSMFLLDYPMGLHLGLIFEM